MFIFLICRTTKNPKVNLKVTGNVNIMLSYPNSLLVFLNQGGPNRGLRTTCGPQSDFLLEAKQFLHISNLLDYRLRQPSQTVTMNH